MMSMDDFISKVTSKIFWECVFNTLSKLVFTIIFTFLPIIIILIKSIAVNLNSFLINGIDLALIIQDVQNKITFYSLYTYIYAFLVPPLIAIFTKKETGKVFLITTWANCLIMALFIALIDESIELNNKSFICLVLFSLFPIGLLGKSIFNDEEECLKYAKNDKAIKDIASNSDNLRGKNE